MAGYKRVALSTIREDIFNNISTLIDSNKPHGWTVVASFPESHPTFPCIIINSAKVSFKNHSLLRSKYKQSISLEVEIFALAKSGKEAIDQAKDSIQSTLTAAYGTLRTYGLVLDMENPFTDSDVTTDIINDNKLNSASMDINLRLA